jgi:tripartite-type tricarboxylate transporter receptor subunit TctC
VRTMSNRSEAQEGHSMTPTRPAELSERWGQLFSVGNLPGGAGTIGTSAAARAPADGHTAVVVTSSFWINPGLYTKAEIRSHSGVCARDNHRGRTSRPGGPPVISGPRCARTGRHRWAEQAYVRVGRYRTIVPSGGRALQAFDRRGPRARPVQWRGAGVVDCRRAHVDRGYLSLPAVAAYIKGGQLHALAVTSSAQCRMCRPWPRPGSPIKNPSSCRDSCFLPAPAKQLVDRLHREILRIVALPDVRERLSMLGFDGVANTREGIQCWIQSEVPQWAEVVQQANLKVSE